MTFGQLHVYYKWRNNKLSVTEIIENYKYIFFAIRVTSSILNIETETSSGYLPRINLYVTSNYKTNTEKNNVIHLLC